MLALLAPHVPLAYLTARSAVARGRRGDVPDWRELPVRLARLAGLPARRRNHFQSAARAQAWFEWRRHGRSLPALVALLLPFELGFLFLIRETPALVFYTLAGVLVTPPFMAGFVAATVSRPNPERAGLARRVAVHGDAAALDRRAHRGAAQSHDLEHDCRVGAGPRRHSAGGVSLGHLARGDGARPASSATPSVRRARSWSRCWCARD